MDLFIESKRQGFSYIETDVRFTSDNVPVLLHDNTIDRTSNGSGFIEDLTFEKVRAYDFGAWFSEDFVGTAIPSLEECLVFCRSTGMKVYLHIKVCDSSNVQILVDLIEKYNMKNNVTFISESLPQLEYILACDDAFRVGYTVNDITEEIIAETKTLMTGNNEVFINTTGFTRLEDCIAENIPVEYHHVGDSMEELLNMNDYVSGITSSIYVPEELLFDKAMLK